MASNIDDGEPVREPRGLLLIDGFNLLHAAILKGRDRAGWWKAENQGRVLKLVRAYQGAEECWLVFDAARVGSERLSFGEQVESDSEPLLIYAPSADDRIVGLAQEHVNRSPTIVSADRALQDRCRRWGTKRMSPWSFADLCRQEP